MPTRSCLSPVSLLVASCLLVHQVMSSIADDTSSVSSEISSAQERRGGGGTSLVPPLIRSCFAGAVASLVRAAATST